MQNPEVAFRDCAKCLRYLHDHETGRVIKDKDGQPVPRPKNQPPACHLQKGCQKGRYRHPQLPDENKSLTLYNRRAYQHYLECKETGDWPRGVDGKVDPIVRYNATLIAEAVRLAKWSETTRLRIATEATGKMMAAVMQSWAGR